MSTTSPKQKPTRMPCFTQTLTRQPVGEDGSGSAARTRPAASSARSRANVSRACVFRCVGTLFGERGDLLLQLDHEARAAAPRRRSCCSTAITFSRAAGLGDTSGRR